MLEKPLMLEKPDIGAGTCSPSEHTGTRKQNTFFCAVFLQCPILTKYSIMTVSKEKIFKGLLHFCGADNKG